VFAMVVSVLALPPRAFLQGSVPAHYMSLSLGANGIQGWRAENGKLGVPIGIFFPRECSLAGRPGTGPLLGERRWRRAG